MVFDTRNERPFTGNDSPLKAEFEDTDFLLAHSVTVHVHVFELAEFKFRNVNF